MRQFLFLFILFIVSCDENSGNKNNGPESTLDIYVSDTGDFQSGPWQIVRYNEFGNKPHRYITSNLGQPQDILFLEDQQIVLITNFSTGTITQYHSETGAFQKFFATGLFQPTRMKIGPDGYIYVLNWSDNENNVFRFQQDGTALGKYTSVGVRSAIGIDWDSSGNMYVSSYYDAYIRKYDSDGNDLGKLITTNLQGPTNLWLDESNNIFVIDYNGGNVKEFSSNGSLKRTFISGLGQAEGVEFFDNGDILIGNGINGSVRMYNSEGTYIKTLVRSGSGGLIRPNALRIRKYSD
jgi:WD40 repeat protein